MRTVNALWADGSWVTVEGVCSGGRPEGTAWPERDAIKLRCVCAGLACQRSTLTAIWVVWRRLHQVKNPFSSLREGVLAQN